MTTTTKQIFTGDKSQLEACYKDLAQQVTRLDDKLHRLTTTSAAGSERAKASMSGLNSVVRQGVGEVAALSAQYVGFTAILRGVNMELEELKRLQSGAAQTQLTVADSQAEVLKAMTGASSGERSAMLKEIVRIQKESKFPDMKEMNLAAAAGLQAGGTPKAVAESVAAAVLIAKNKPGELKELVGSELDIRKASGIQDPRKNLGFLLNVAEAARVEGLENTFRNVAPAIISGTSTVPQQDPVQASKEIGAFFSAASQMTGDRRGDRTETFATQYAIQLRDFFREGREVDGPGGQKHKIKPDFDPGTFHGRQAALQADPVMAQQFLEGASFMGAYKVSAEQSLQRDSQFSKFQREAEQKIDFSADRFNSLATDLKGLTDELALADVRRTSEGTQQESDLGMTIESIASEARKIRDEAIERTRQHSVHPPGLRFAIETANLAVRDMLDSPETAVDSAIRAMEVRKKHIEESAKRNREFGKQGENFTFRQAEDLLYLDQKLAELKALSDRQAIIAERQLKALEEMNERDRNRTTSGPASSVGPAANGEPGIHSERGRPWGRF